MVQSFIHKKIISNAPAPDSLWFTPMQKEALPAIVFQSLRCICVGYLIQPIQKWVLLAVFVFNSKNGMCTIWPVQNGVLPAIDFQHQNNMCEVLWSDEQFCSSEACKKSVWLNDMLAKIKPLGSAVVANQQALLFLPATLNRSWEWCLIQTSRYL